MVNTAKPSNGGVIMRTEACAVWPSCHRNSRVRTNGRVRISHRCTLAHWFTWAQRSSIELQAAMVRTCGCASLAGMAATAPAPSSNNILPCIFF